jgi:uncharacterized protein (UPF0261 family)
VKKVYVIGTCDTKGDELDFAISCVRATGLDAVLVDVSTIAHSHNADVAAITVAAAHPQGSAAALSQTDRGEAVSAMARALAIWLPQQKDIAGVLGLGGSVILRS